MTWLSFFEIGICECKSCAQFELIDADKVNLLTNNSFSLSNTFEVSDNEWWRVGSVIHHIWIKVNECRHSPKKLLINEQMAKKWVAFLVQSHNTLSCRIIPGAWWFDSSTDRRRLVVPTSHIDISTCNEIKKIFRLVSCQPICFILLGIIHSLIGHWLIIFTLYFELVAWNFLKMMSNCLTIS